MKSFNSLMAALLPLLAAVVPAFSQTATDEDYHVFTDSPRLLVTNQRLRLLQRERQRESMRWQQFDGFVSGGAPMPESGFALALYYQVVRDPAAGKKAVEWAVGNSADPLRDLRQLALVFDWCAPVMTKQQTDAFVAKLQRGLETPAPPGDIRRNSARALAAIAVADQLPDHGEAILKKLIQDWWRGDIVKRLAKGEPAIPREQLYALYEMLHGIRDNLRIDLRESAPEYFKALPVDHIAGHYPAPFEGPENDYRVPIYAREGEPDLTDATLSRAAELSMVAFDNNAPESQFLQGWLMQDRFLMRSALGTVYEFLWANPYQPGLSYFHIPLVFHDAGTGHVFARTSWDEDATWIGYFDGHLQYFADGKLQALRPGAATKPVHVGEAVLLSAPDPEKGRFRADAEAVFVLNLTPRAHYDVEVDDQELWEAETDVGGTLVLSLPEGTDAGVRIRRRTN
ncbi:MAG: hypothetical protein ABSB35_25380 [Bryobacteraceae bacterium]